MVKPVSSIASKFFAPPLKKLSELKYMQKLSDYAVKNPGRFAGYAALSSLVLKDAIGCYMYVKQSWNNEKIPKEKRGFVAALDLSNGGLNIVTQILAYVLLGEKALNWIFDKTLGRFFAKGSLKTTCEKIPVDKLKTSQKYQFWHSMKETESTCRAGFKFLLPLVAATILAKRVIVPLIATPMADGMKKRWFSDKDDVKNCDNQDVVKYTSSPEVYSKFLNQKSNL